MTHDELIAKEQAKSREQIDNLMAKFEELLEMLGETHFSACTVWEGYLFVNGAVKLLNELKQATRYDEIHRVLKEVETKGR